MSEILSHVPRECERCGVDAFIARLVDLTTMSAEMHCAACSWVARVAVAKTDTAGVYTVAAQLRHIETALRFGDG